MSEEPLQEAEQAIRDARKAAAETPIMPFDDGPAGATPDETGGAVAEHGDTGDAGDGGGDGGAGGDTPGDPHDTDDPEVEHARTQVGQGSTEEGRSANAAADEAEARATAGDTGTG